MDARLDGAENRLRVIRKAAHAQSTDDAALQAAKEAIAPVQADLADALSTLGPKLDDVAQRLAELGPAPAAGQPPEAPDVAEARARLLKFQKSLQDNSKRARLLGVEAGQLSDSLDKRLRQNFTTRLWAHSRSVLDPTLWGDVAAKLPDDLQRLRAAAAAQVNLIAATPPRGAAEIWSAILAVLGLFLLTPARILLGRLGRRVAANLIPGGGLRKSALALWLTLVDALTPLFAAQLAFSALRGVTPLTPAANALAHALVDAIAIAAAIDALGRSLLSPGRPEWRLAPVSDSFADRVAIFPAVIGVAAALSGFLARANIALGASQATAEASRCLVVVVQLLAVGAALAWARSTTAAPEQRETRRSRAPWVLAAIAAWLALVVSLLAVATGYVAFASFVMHELIWIVTVLTSLFLLMRFVDDLCEALFAPRHGLSRLIGAATGLSDQALEQIGVLLSGVLRLGLIIFAWMAIVAPLGASMRDIFARATSTEMVFKLGQISVSPGLIFGGVVVFAAGLLITRVVRGWVETTYLPKTSIDVGLRASITAGLTYLGALVALVTTCAYLGLSLSNIALFASALSVGIGFGLQAVIGNFVSGLILLAERPVKVGDRIAKTVRNVTHGGALGQVKIVLRVVADADPAEIRTLFLEQLAAHPGVLRDPPPGVYLTSVAGGALEFTALATVASARQAFAIRSDLLFAMVAQLKAKGVNLAPS
jgi:small-conductance mechanosensitive channel